MNCLILLPAESRWLRSPRGKSRLRRRRGIETQQLDPCEEKHRLRVLLNAAAKHYAATVNDANLSRGKTSKEEYDRIQAVVDEARKTAEAAHHALEQHKKEHGC